MTLEVLLGIAIVFAILAAYYGSKGE